jgi:hypothetical protein
MCWRRAQVDLVLDRCRNHSVLVLLHRALACELALELRLSGHLHGPHRSSPMLHRPDGRVSCTDLERGYHSRYPDNTMTRLSGRRHQGLIRVDQVPQERFCISLPEALFSYAYERPISGIKRCELLSLRQRSISGRFIAPTVFRLREAAADGAKRAVVRRPARRQHRPPAAPPQAQFALHARPHPTLLCVPGDAPIRRTRVCQRPQARHQQHEERGARHGMRGVVAKLFAPVSPRQQGERDARRAMSAARRYADFHTGAPPAPVPPAHSIAAPAASLRFRRDNGAAGT